MNKYILSAVILVLFSNISPAHAGQGALNRSQIINREMDCVSSHLNRGLGWDDLCYSYSSPSPQSASTSDGGGSSSESPKPQSYQYAAAKQALDSYGQPVDKEEERQSVADNETLSDTEFSHAGPFTKQNLSNRHVHTFDFGFEPYFAYYEEPDIPIKNRGMMYGYYGNYAYRPPEGNILNNMFVNAYMVQGRYATGDLDYKGSGTVEGKRNTNYEIRALLGKDYKLRDQSLITPYFGFGYRYLLDKGNDMLTPGFYGYDRHSNYWYAPLGITATSPVVNGWSGGLNFEYDIFARGLQVSDLSAGKPYNGGFDNPNIHSVQTKGFGVRGSFKLMYGTPKINFYVEPFVRYWKIEDSRHTIAEIDGTLQEGLEPKNYTTEIGSKIGVQF